MPTQLEVTIRDARADLIESQIGASPILRIFEGALPADTDAANTGTKLVDMTLPADWLTASSAGQKSKLGQWAVKSVAAGLAGYWRIYDPFGTICLWQGDCGATGSGASMEFDDPNIPNKRWVLIDTFNLIEGNA